MIFQNADLLQIQVHVDNEEYPRLQCDFTQASFIFDQAYNSLVRCGLKHLDTDTRMLVTKTNFPSLFPIFAFDVTNASGEVLSSNSSHMIKVDVSFRTNTEVEMFLIYTYDKTIKQYLSNGKIEILEQKIVLYK